MKIDHYLALRGALHHDWLLNRFLVFLSARAAELDKGGALRQDRWQRLAEWREKKEAFLALSAGVEEAVSPRQLLDEPPLAKLPDALRAEIGTIIHERFCKQSGIRMKAARLGREVEAMDGLIERALGAKGFSGAGTGLCEKCNELSKAISDLPARIQVF